MKKSLSLRESVYGYIKKKYGADPEYLWMRFPDYAVFRHGDNRKWFGIIMDLPRYKLGISGTESVDVLNIKLGDPLLIDMLAGRDGFRRAYHMNRGNWISVLLDGTVPLGEICELLDRSFRATASAKSRQKLRPPKEWLIPANPEYYDIEHAFDKKDELDWKQGKGIKAGDTVFIYVGAPVSAILFKCAVTKTDIPYDYKGKELRITALMHLKLLKRYAPERFTFKTLNDEYGIFAVRGPRGVPHSLSEALKS